MNGSLIFVFCSDQVIQHDESRPFLMTLFTFTIAAAQNAELHFTLKGTVNVAGYPSPLPGIAVVMLNGNDTLAVTVTDSSGQYSFPDTLLKQTNRYSIYGSKRCYEGLKAEIDLAVLEFSHDLLVDLILLRKLHCRKWDNSAYFDWKAYKTIDNFEIEDLKETLLEFPGIRIEFTLFQLKSEPRRLAGKRMKAFRGLLDLNGVSEDQCRINPVAVIVPGVEKPAEGSFRSCFQGKVVRMD